MMEMADAPPLDSPTPWSSLILSSRRHVKNRDCIADDGRCDVMRDLSNSVGNTMKIIFLSEVIKEQAARNPEK